MKSSKTRDKRRPPVPEMTLTSEGRLDLLADIVIERILEEEKLYKERLKTDPHAKRVFEVCKCEKCSNKNTSQASK